MNFLITYDLHKPVQNYQRLTDALKKMGSVHAMESVWLVKSNTNSGAICRYLTQFIDNDDALFVCIIPVPGWDSVRLPQAAVSLLRS